jgi:ABC-type Zn2+ transport system substrate-binding protein/surface adhesin
VAGKQARAQCSQKYCEEGAGFQQGVAADQFAGIEHLRQQTVFSRREECRVRAHHEQREQQQHHPMLRKTDARHDHDGDFQRLDALENAGLVEALA